MKKKLLLMLTLCLLAQWSVAQAPKWVDKAKRAVFSVAVSYTHLSSWLVSQTYNL